MPDRRGLVAIFTSFSLESGLITDDELNMSEGGDVTSEERIPANRSSVTVARGLRRWLSIVLGCAFVGLAAAGVVLPGLPTTPFLLVASYFFIRSSPRLHRRLLQSDIFGPILRDWHAQRGIKRRVRVIAVVGCTLTIGLSLLLGDLPWPARLVVAVAGTYGIWFVARLPFVPDDSVP